jgi:hypothetical protein
MLVQAVFVFASVIVGQHAARIAQFAVGVVEAHWPPVW